jgi:hypothetical protein
MLARAWTKKSKDVQIDLASGEISICEIRPHILWSNKYTPLDDFILTDTWFAEWTSKLTFKDRLEVSILTSDKEDQLVLLYLTKRKFEIADPEKIIIARAWRIL